MASVRESAELPAPVERTWAVISDPAKFGSWVDNHEGFVGEAPTAFTPGTTFGQRVNVMGMPADVSWTVEDVQVGRSLTLKGAGPMGIGLHASYALEPSAAGTTVSAELDFSGAAVMAVGAMLEKQMGEMLQTSLGRLRTLVAG
jgi:uncharacterized protein YndB with AHSA1/START domain